MTTASDVLDRVLVLLQVLAGPGEGRSQAEVLGVVAGPPDGAGQDA